jgi:endoglucanase
MHTGEDWAFTRVATASAFTAATYASFPGVKGTEYGTKALCYARSQLGYVVGDTGFSYVVGFGEKYPLQVHHRDSVCTLDEDAAGKCACVAPSSPL